MCAHLSFHAGSSAQDSRSQPGSCPHAHSPSLCGPPASLADPPPPGPHPVGSHKTPPASTHIEFPLSLHRQGRRWAEGSEARRKGTFGFLSKNGSKCIHLGSLLVLGGGLFCFDCAKYAISLLPPKAWSMGWLISKADLLRVADLSPTGPTACGGVSLTRLPSDPSVHYSLGSAILPECLR